MVKYWVYTLRTLADVTSASNNWELEAFPRCLCPFLKPDKSSAENGMTLNARSECLIIPLASWTGLNGASANLGRLVKLNPIPPQRLRKEPYKNELVP